MTELPPTSNFVTPGPSVRPHRGVAVLVLGILGLVACPICGIIAWVMGNGDVREMLAGRMDPSGLSITKAGKICGMIATILILGWLAIVFMGGAGSCLMATTVAPFGGAAYPLQ